MEVIPLKAFKIPMPYPRYPFAIATQVQSNSGRPVKYPDKVAVVLLEMGLVKEQGKAAVKQKVKAKAKAKAKPKSKVSKLFGNKE
jgi:hypothetical protein